jgi:hypothetical protein
MPQGNIVPKHAFDALVKEVADLRKQIEELKAKQEKRPYTRKEVENGYR